MKTLPRIFAVLVFFVSLQAQELRAGYAKADITPTGRVNLGGYSLRMAPSDGIHGNDKLYVRALIFDNRQVKVAFVEADVIGIRGHDAFRRQIAEATGIPSANILLGDVHNPAAPFPDPRSRLSSPRTVTSDSAMGIRSSAIPDSA